MLVLIIIFDHEPENIPYFFNSMELWRAGNLLLPAYIWVKILSRTVSKGIRHKDSNCVIVKNIEVSLLSWEFSSGDLKEHINSSCKPTQKWNSVKERQKRSLMEEHGNSGCLPSQRRNSANRGRVQWTHSDYKLVSKRNLNWIILILAGYQ